MVHHQHYAPPVAIHIPTFEHLIEQEQADVTVILHTNVCSQLQWLKMTIEFMHHGKPLNLTTDKVMLSQKHKPSSAVRKTDMSLAR